MKYKKIITRSLLVLLVVFILIQFFRPAKNIDLSSHFSHEISTKYPLPDSIQTILEKSCYDCHSNNTVYPWYASIQPAAWWLNSHIKEGKREINFSEFTSYPIRRQYKKLKDLIDQVKEDEMPLSSYTLIHRYAILSKPQQDALINWASGLRDSIKANYPPDSLVKK